METAFIIVGIEATMAFLSSRAANPYLKTLLYFMTALFTFSTGWIAYFSVSQSEQVAMNLLRYVCSVYALAYFFAWAGFWIAGRAEKEEWKDGDQDM